MSQQRDALRAGLFETLHIDHLTREFGAMVALRELSLAIQRGEFIALLGPSGCGKSTALNCIAGLLQPSSGRILLDNRRVDTLPPEKRGFGMVFQNYALFPHMTVRKNVAFGLAMRRTPRAETRERVEGALRLVQLTAHGDKLPGQLSGGQQQRVAIARAIAVNPPLILMDEPLSNLDAKLRLEMRHEIRRIHQEVRRTTIYVTHDQDEALSLADRIVVMQDGVVQQVGTPEALYARPANLDVARFMGYRNLLRFDLAQPAGGGVRLNRGGLSLLGTLQGGTAGGPATAAVRPEEILVGTGPNSVEARVVEAEYCGRDYLIDAETPLGLLHARVPQHVAAGDVISLVLPPERVLAFADAATPDAAPIAAAAE